MYMNIILIVKNKFIFKYVLCSNFRPHSSMYHTFRPPAYPGTVQIPPKFPSPLLPHHPALSPSMSHHPLLVSGSKLEMPESQDNL